MKTLHTQQGASVTGVVVLIIALGLLAKFGLAVVPAYVGNYQLTKLVTSELKNANIAKMTDRQFLAKVEQQLSINANYNTKAEDVISFTNKAPGNLSIKLNYSEEHQYYGSTFIVNRFEKTITAADAAVAKD